MSLEKLYQCTDGKKINYSQAREAIYKVLLESDDCLSVPDILKEVAKVYPKKISLNTVYRHLNLFVDCNLAAAIQDNFKKAYYCCLLDDSVVFNVCSKCNFVGRVPLNSQKILNAKSLLGDDDRAFITLHKQCENCILKRGHNEFY